jgi:hypothetical protein
MRILVVFFTRGQVCGKEVHKGYMPHIDNGVTIAGEKTLLLHHASNPSPNGGCVDVNVRAFRTVQAALSGDSASNSKRESSRRGGLKGGPSRAKALSKERKLEIAQKANAARWQHAKGR